MPALQNLVLTDRESTPVDHTFVPADITNGVATVIESNGVPVGESKFSIASRKTASRRKVSLRLMIPITQTETINGVDRPVVVRTAYANVEFNFDATSEEQERDNIVGMLADALGSSSTLVNDTVVSLEGVY